MEGIFAFSNNTPDAMRLGQLARKISVRPAAIVEYLQKQKNIVVDEGSNARIEDAYVAELINYFAPDLLIAKAPEPAVIEAITEEVVEPELVETVLAEAEQAPAVEEEAPLDVAVAEEEKQYDVIKAPKVELPGLRVIGKIELPEPKKKEVEGEDIPTPEEDASAKETREPKRAMRSARKPERKDRNEQPRKNPVALQREREQQQAARKREDELQKKKQQRANHYSKKVKVQTPVKATRMRDYEVDVMREVKAEEPKTIWGKVVNWFSRK